MMTRAAKTMAEDDSRMNSGRHMVVGTTGMVKYREDGTTTKTDTTDTRSITDLQR